MAYCSRQDLVDRIGEDLLKDLTDREAAGRVNEARVAQSITAASAEIDSYAGERYPVPLSPVPDTVRARAVDIAIYRLLVARGHEAASTDGSWAALYRDALDWLKELAKGETGIGVVTPAPQGDQPSVMVAPVRIFDRDTLKGF